MVRTTLLAGFLFACSSTTQPGAAPPADAGPSYETSACGSCVKEACAPDVTSCGGDPECAAYLGCVYKCPNAATGDVDPACEAQCPKPTSSAGLKAMDRLGSCRSTGPGSHCPACGQVSGGTGVLKQTCGKSTETPPCFICEDEKCCETYARCHANPACEAYKQCLLACPKGQKCEASCDEKHPGALKDWAPRMACMSVRCAEPCLNGEPLDPCVKCATQDCADFYADLVSTPAGYLLQSCVAVCRTADEACITACKEKHPSAVTSLNTLLTCVLQKCPTTC
jgi:hypothetical protein